MEQFMKHFAVISKYRLGQWSFIHYPPPPPDTSFSPRPEKTRQGVSSPSWETSCRVQEGLCYCLWVLSLQMAIRDWDCFNLWVSTFDFDLFFVLRVERVFKNMLMQSNAPLNHIFLLLGWRGAPSMSSSSFWTSRSYRASHPVPSELLTNSLKHTLYLVPCTTRCSTTCTPSFRQPFTT